MILDKFPDAKEFYKTYWGKKPFVVRGAIAAEVFDDLIDGDSLAGLSLEEDIKSRIVLTSDDKIICEHGPFEEERFSTLGDNNWSLLVQNVEQYHTDTAKLLQSFSFAPRWLMDDIMVSYSTGGGGVGPHMDSYHVFLVQGMGKRKWKIGRTLLEDEDYIKGMDLKVFKHDFEGEEFEVCKGDVIYIPPHFGHEGITIEEAMTFSVGFLVPQISELFAEYGHYLEQRARLNKYYMAQGLTKDSAGFILEQGAQEDIQADLIEAIKSDDFSAWLAEYFSIPTHDEIENIQRREDLLSSTELLEILHTGKVLQREEHIKLSVTISAKGTINLAVYGQVVPSIKAQEKLIFWLNGNNILSINDIDCLGGSSDLMPLITELYNLGVLEFKN